MTTKERAQAAVLRELKHCSHGCYGKAKCPHERKWEELMRREGLIDYEGRMTP